MGSFDRSYFHDLYADSPDPWQFESSWYEQRKYAMTMAALPQPRYHSAFEPGCSIGVLTSLLAERCDQLLSTDIIPEALERARQRCAHQRTVRFASLAIPEQWPRGPFDLTVLSEIVYYFDRDTLNGIIDNVVATSCPYGTVVAVHWRGETNYPLTGDEVHHLIEKNPQLERTVHYVDSDFVLDVWLVRRPVGGEC